MVPSPYLFSKKGVISFEKGDEDTIMEAALEAGAEDVVTYDDGAIDVYTAWEEMGAVRDALEAAGLKADAAEVSMIPSTKADMDAETAPAAASDRYARRLRRRAGSVP